MPVGQKYNVNVEQLGQAIEAPKQDDDGVKKLINKLAKQASNAKIIERKDGSDRDAGLKGGVGGENTSVDGKTTPGGVVSKDGTINLGGQSFSIGEGFASLAPEAQKQLGKLAGDPRFAGLPLSAQTALAKLFADNPQLGQQALQSFTTQMNFPGAEKAFNTPLLQGEAMLVTVALLQQPGGEKKLKDLEGGVAKFAQAYGSTGANERTKLMMFREVVKTNSPQAKAALDAAQLIDKGGAQESLVDIVRSAGSDPAKAQEKLGSLGKMLNDPKILNAKDGGAVAKAVSQFVGKSDGGRSALIEMEKFVDQSKMGNLSAATIRNFSATTGTVQGSGQKQVGQTFEAPKQGGPSGVDIKGLLRKRSEKASEKEGAGAGEKLPPGVSGVRPKALPPIERFDPESNPEARDQQYQAQFASWQKSFHEREKFIAANSKNLKRLGVKELENVQKEITAAGSLEEAIGAHSSPQAMAEATGCDIRFAEQAFKWDSELKEQRAKFSKEVSMARRMARAKGNKAEMRTERPPPPPREIRIAAQLEAHMADELMSEFRMAWTGGASGA